ncbi:MAG: adenosylcobinamide amidohydrolase [Thermodesulfobacteriota bacterium]|nr:adenosylcobinamide amidohydrolase [Thermodesulfobacteriota bacterium]
MKIKKRFLAKSAGLLFVILFVTIWTISPALSYPVTFVDSSGETIIIDKKPEKVVSLVPSITEIIFKVGAGDAVKAFTYHDSCPGEPGSKQIVGGFFSPSLKGIEAIRPDIIFFSRLHKKVMEKFGHGKCKLIDLETDSISDSYTNIILLGRIFNKEKQAAKLIDEIKRQLRIISEKVDRIPDSKRKRVLRLMGRDPVMTPGDDSFQNEMIRAAGGIPPVLGKKGNIVVITKEEWVTFNPQIIYGCGGDRKTAKIFFNRPGWKDVEAVKNGKIFYFPCDLTCRAATHTGYFVSWLASRIYTDEFSKKGNQVLEEKIFKSRGLSLDLDYIKDTRISYSHIHDFLNKTLIIDFKKPMSLVSTLEGERNGIKSVGNHYSSPPCWGINHKSGLNNIRKRVYQVINKSEDTASFLYTGADMDNLAIKREKFRNMEVCALVTAGVKSNAVRMSRYEGRFYEPGTINIILLPNMKLTPRAMTRAIIGATEAKTAALMDLDIRSSYSSRLHQATGTGTDNIIVVRGTGTEIDNAGGHSKLGKLIAKAVYQGVREAICKQNKITASRDIFQRLQERQISIYSLVSGMKCEGIPKKCALLGAVEKILLDPRYSGFIESALVISDNYEKGLVKNLSTYQLWCHLMAEEIAGKKMDQMRELVSMDDMPVVLKMALNAILNGVSLIKL